MHQETIRISTSSGYVCPLAGLQIKEPAIQLGSLLLVRLNRSEWEMIERRYVFKDWYSMYYSANPVFAYQSLEEETDKKKVIDEIDYNITRLISALRLHKPGYIVDPIYTVKCLYNDGIYNRVVGPYRTEYLASPIDKLTYDLKADEHTIVNGIYNVLARIDEIPDNDLVANLVNNFNLSFLPALSSYFSLNTLYTSLEMLYGRIDAALCKTTSLYKRAFAMIIAQYGILNETDEWQIFYTNQIHPLRNIVHHHKKNDLQISKQQAKFYLQESIRLGIRMLMRLYILKADGRFENLLVNFSKNVSPKELLNISLEKLADGDNSLFEKILSN